jgi:hypothetical protein
VPLPRVARVSALAAELVLAARVEERQLGVVETAAQLLERRHRLEVRVELVSVLVQLHHPLLELTLPRRQAARQHRDRRMPSELRELRRGRRSDAVAAVVEHEPLLAGDAVAP